MMERNDPASIGLNPDLVHLYWCIPFAPSDYCWYASLPDPNREGQRIWCQQIGHKGPWVVVSYDEGPDMTKLEFRFQVRPEHFNHS